MDIDLVVADMQKDINDINARTGFAIQCLEHALAFFNQLPTVAENPDPTVSMGVGPPGEPGSKEYARWRLSNVKRELASDGPPVRQLGHQWVVVIYAI